MPPTRFRIRTMMIGTAAIAAFLDAVQSLTRAGFGCWGRIESPIIVIDLVTPEAAYFEYNHKDTIADSYSSFCNTCGAKWDAAYEIQPSAVVAATTLSAGFFAVVIRACVSLRRLRVGSMQPDRNGRAR
jgi:hypothetical protein